MCPHPAQPSTKDWYDFSIRGSIRQWPKNGMAESPFKGGRVAAVRSIPPNGDDPNMIKIDIAHTYAIAGYGKEELASTLVFLAVRCHVFGHGAFEKQLDLAYTDFKRFCMVTGKRTTIDDFSKKELKITSLLACFIFFCGGWNGNYGVNACVTGL